MHDYISHNNKNRTTLQLSTSCFRFVGYRDLSDLALDYLCGNCNNTPGLTQLTELTLPKDSHVTVEGLKTLLMGLPMLTRLRHAGNLGLVFASEDFEPFHPLALKDFEQTRSLERAEDEDATGK